MERCSHALVVDGTVWVIDPVDGNGVEERIRAMGTPAGVVQLLDRHNRDCAAIAARLGVRHHVVPQGSLGPFACIAVKESASWNEIALWWPDRRVLVSADVLGTARTTAPSAIVLPSIRCCGCARRERSLALQPEVILCGHGEGVLDECECCASRSAQHIAAADPRAAGCRFRRVAGAPAQLAARKPTPIASAPPAASKKKWLPVPTITISITTG